MNDQPEQPAVAVQRIAELAVSRPLMALGVSACVGYTLGGGLPKWAVRLGMAAGFPWLARAFVRSIVERDAPA